MPRTIPDQGLSEDEILTHFDELRKADTDWRGGRAFSLVYSAGEEHEAFLKKAHQAFFSDNALNPLACKSSHRLELETVRMAANLFHGGRHAVGSLSSGGTESILLAVKAAKTRAQSQRSLSTPNMVLPETAHVAFDKAGAYFGVEVRYARLRDDYRVDVGDMRKLINGQTILLVGSAPQYVQGVIDPIEEISELAIAKRLPLHVDACVGGYVLPWIEQLGRHVPLWDFRVPGVTSISADLHKYGYAPKGASSIVYRNMDYFKHQFFVSTDWSGGIYAGPTLLGTRGAAPIAAAWASLVKLGAEGYKERTSQALEALGKLRRTVEAHPHLEVVGDPDATLITYRTTKASGVDVFALAEALEDEGWHVDRHQNPNAIHCTVMPQHLPIIDEYTDALTRATDRLAQRPDQQAKSKAAMYGLMAKVPARGLIKQSVLEALEHLYGATALDDDSDPLAQREDDDLVARLSKRYASQIVRALDMFDELADKLPIRRRRKRQKTQ